MKSTVFVVDDDPAVRRSLRFLLESVHLPVECFADGDAFDKAFDPTRKGCLLLDVRMPGRSGLEMYERLKARGPVLPTIIISAHADVATAVNAMKAGVVDFMEKPVNEQALLDRIHKAMATDLQERQERHEVEQIQARLVALTKRELEVLELVVEGKSSKQIAKALDVTLKTVEAHRSGIMAKMQVQNLANLVRDVLKARE